MGDHNNVIAGGASITLGSDLGYILQGTGVVMSVTSEPLYVNVEGMNAEIMARFPKVSYEFTTTLAEPTMQNMIYAYDWQNDSATGASGNVLEFGGENYVPTVREITIFGYVPGSGNFTRQIALDRAVAVPGGEHKYTDTEVTTVPFTFHGLYDSGDSRVGQLIDGTS